MITARLLPADQSHDDKIRAAAGTREEGLARADEIKESWKRLNLDCIHEVWQRGNEVAHHRILGRMVPFNVYVKEGRIDG